MDNNTIQSVLLYIQILTLVALILYTWQTWKMASATRRSVEVAEKSVQEMKEQRDADIAPYVVAYLDAHGEVSGILYLVIKNNGKTVAKNVRINFDPPLEGDWPELLERVLPKDGISSLPPGYEIRTSLANFVKYKQSKPMAFTVDITYFGGLSDKPRQDRYYIDLMLFRGIMTTVETPPPSEEAKALEKISSSGELLVGEVRNIARLISRSPLRRRRFARSRAGRNI